MMKPFLVKSHQLMKALLAIQLLLFLFFYNMCILYKVKLATLVEGDLKAPFSIATTPKCRGGCFSVPWIAPLYP